MKKQLIVTITLLLLALINIQAQELMKKKVEAFRMSEKMKIDGLLSEATWQNAANAKDFVFRWPTPGRTATERTEVKVIYDDYAMYIGAYMYDSKPDSIVKNLTSRDRNNNVDWFFVTFDTYMDGQNGLGFGVTTANVQFDCKYAAANADVNNGDGDGEDFNWDGVWRSEVKMMPDGWVAEMAIPYSALRFPKQTVQNWHVNYFRRIFRKGETDSWNEIKATESGSLRQSGILQGIKDIKMPIRLQATPFVATQGEIYHDKAATPKNATGGSFNAGMDLKYGINEAFTLDATIIPDFGQVRSDNQVVNLSPFEVRFDEFRPFFMEGTELFNKGGLFYSRRIGGRPFARFNASDALSANEEITSNPTKAQLYNSTKLSGRTQAGTGIGVLNAVQAPTFAILRNTLTNQERSVETSPLTNFNVMVIDQNLKNNSAIAFINTNVWREGSNAYDANVSALNWNLKNKKNSYSLSGNYALSQKYDVETTLGHKMNIDVNKLSGNWTWGGSYSEINNTYDQSDLGYQQDYNFRNYNVWGGYNGVEPRGKFNNFWVNTWAWYSTLQQRNAFTDAGIGINVGGNTKNFNNMGINFNFYPRGNNDYFEPRTGDFKAFYYNPRLLNGNFWYSTDNRKKLRFSTGAWGRIFKDENARLLLGQWNSLSYQVNKYIRFNIEINPEMARNDYGFTWRQSDATDASTLKDTDILFGKRNVIGFDNGINATYTFNNKANLQFRARHYWQQVKYESFALLQETGNLQNIAYRGVNEKNDNLHNINANYFNIDCVFTWRFAPGSDLFITWKNAIYNDNAEFLRYNYFGNAGRLLNMPQTNSLNIKLLYFLDYAEIKQKMKVRK